MRILRALLAGLTIAAWSFTIWMASHVSVNPEVLGRWSGSYFAVLLCLATSSTVISCLHLPRAYSWINRNRDKLVALSLSLILCAIFVETAVRVGDVNGISFYEESRRYHLDKIPDPDLYYQHRPGFESVYQDVPISFNEFGFPDGPISEKLPGEFRILFVGDSVVAGLAVPRQETFCARTAAILGEKLGRPVRAINSGCGSYNTAQETALVRKYISRLEPDLVLLVYVENDEGSLETSRFDPWSKVSLASKSPPQALRILAWNSWTFRLFSHALRQSGSGAAGEELASGPAWDASFSAVSEMAATCREANVRFGVLLWRVRESPLTDAIWLRLEEICGNSDTPVGDFATAFADVEPREVLVSVVDPHANAKGHAIAAQYIADFVDRHGLAAP